MAIASLRSDRTLRVHIERIERMARRHEQAVPVHAAEAKIGAALGQRNLTDLLALRVVDRHPVEVFARARAAPEIAEGVDTEAIEDVAAIAADDDARIRKFCAV